MSSATLEWQFGGWLAGLSPATAGGILAGVAVLGGLAIWWLYRRTLRALSPSARFWLTSLRVALLLAVLLCLANPSRVTTAKPAPKERGALAVVVDRSASMDAVDARGKSRRHHAADIWQRHVGEADERFEKMSWYRFGTALEPAPSLEEAMRTGDPAPETRLYGSLAEVLERTPDAVVCLTDGLDTLAGDAAKVASAAQRGGVPLYFVVGSNHLRPGEMLNIRDVRVPSRVLRRTRFTARAVLEVASPTARDLPVELWSGGQRLATAKFPVRPGLNTFPWAVPVDAGEPGPLPLEFRVGEGSAQQIAASTTKVIEKTTVDILYYQGALQWGYRFLLSALRSDPSFRLTSIVNPALGLKMSASTGELAELRDIPDTVADLKKYQIVVLAHVFADQLTPRQQRALLDYAKAGGGVLFIAPDSAATSSFAGTSLEQMLPVIFEPARAESPGETAARRFREQMRTTGGSQIGEAALNGLGSGGGPGARPLLPFALPEGVGRSKLAELFAAQDPASLPKFSEYAAVRHAKAGAEVLAVHPQACEADGRTPRVLLARQQFGEGFTAALTTDLLWRWKMSLPHESRAPEKFWQQLLLSLTPPTGEGLRIVKGSATGAINQPVTFRVEGAASGRAPQAAVVPPGGAARPLELRPGDAAGAWMATFQPEAGGRWELQASEPGGSKARMTLAVAEKQQSRETANLPADVEGLRRLAESTGGALIEDEPAFPPRGELIEGERRTSQPLWAANWCLALLLGLYGTELLTRRWLKLL